jgi:hypothetical protein
MRRLPPTERLLKEAPGKGSLSALGRQVGASANRAQKEQSELRGRDVSIPAARIRQEQALVVADRAALEAEIG